MSVTAPAVLTLQDVAVAIGHTPVLAAVDLSLRPGQVVGVMGANGSGKSTLLEVCATVRKPTRGRGDVLGVPLVVGARGALASVEVRRRICLVSHQPALYPRLSLRENLRFVARLHGCSTDRVEHALEVVGLTDAAERRLEQCSQGMARRTDLARVLLVRPSLLLLDEAHASLDGSAADLVAHVVAGVRNRGGASLVVSHDREGLGVLVDDLVELAGGRLATVEAVG